jgi:two-component system, OmpR family, response regulator
MRLLIVEDDAPLASGLRRILEAEGHAVDVTSRGEQAVLAAAQERFDLVILDIGLPQMDGFEVLRRLRSSGSDKNGPMPVLVLTARDAVDDRVRGLDLGADDYMVKPFALAELSARLRAVMRRGAARENVLRVADLEIDTLRRTVRRAGRPIDLKPKEYALLEFLVRNSDRPVTKSLIIEHVWNIHFDSVSNVVEVHINSLRNKIDRGFDKPLIHTIRGVGYILTDHPPA